MAPRAALARCDSSARSLWIVGVDAAAQARYRRHLSPWPVPKVTRLAVASARPRAAEPGRRASPNRAEPGRRRRHFSLSGGEAESGERAAAGDDRRAGKGRGGKRERERAATAAPPGLFAPKSPLT